MAAINSTPLTFEKVRQMFIFDEITGLFTRRIKTGRGTHVGQEVGSWDMHGYKTVRIEKASYKLHRLAWLYVYGYWPDGDVDHINGVRHDNRFSNLRAVSRQTNLQNQRRATSQNKSTGILGVYMARLGNFYAAISVNNKKKHLGTFPTIEDAKQAYLEAKRRVHPGCMI